MAPEIFLQNAIYTVKADVFSFALVVWELVVGRIPFENLKPGIVPQNINLLNGSLKFFSLAAAAAAVAYHHERPPVPPHCPKPIEQLMVKAWHPDASNRPTFSEILLVCGVVIVAFW
jgi:serine/threonine-protein kinase TNNI3K